ncbi:MAG: hypothetical protein PF440_03850 [Thiomicrorhabdus sp.]|jgi:hypothetical protein|nr:hypothetical protein [Thiomicrorhabdus sp.]
MERETRYLVVKYKDMLKYMTEEEQMQFIELAKKVDAGREKDARHVMECVVVEKDWPEYDEVWMAIAMRVDRENGQPNALKARLDQIEKYGYSPV